MTYIIMTFVLLHLPIYFSYLSCDYSALSTQYEVGSVRLAFHSVAQPLHLGHSTATKWTELMLFLIHMLQHMQGDFSNTLKSNLPVDDKVVRPMLT